MSATSSRLPILAVAFLIVSVVVETLYSWRHLGDPYYLLKVVGWLLLAAGAIGFPLRLQARMVCLAAGWAWMGSNFWRALADRVRTLHGGGTLRLGFLEIL